MKEQTHMDIIGLAEDDLRGADPTTIGIAMLSFHRQSDGSVGIRMGSTVPPERVFEAFRAILFGDDVMHRVPGIERRKTV